MRKRTIPAGGRDDEIYLGGPYGRVQVRFYEEVRRQVEAMIATLEPGKAYTARQICGEAFWAHLGILAARRVGMCLRDLGDRGLVALVPVTPKGKYPRKYRLK